MGTPFRPATVLALLLVAAPPLGGATPAADPWQDLAPGLEFARFHANEQVTVEVLRIDPARWQTVALAVSEVGGSPRAPAAWAREYGLRAVVNAGMYGTDRRTHTGYFRSGDHLNNGVWNRRDYQQAACFEPREPGLPRFTLLDLDAPADTALARRYEVVVQNLRLVRRPRENRWSPGTRPWREVCLGEDARGRMLWIHCPAPLPMHDLVEILLALPLELVAAQHLEGNGPAQLWIADHDRGATAAGWPLPNVLGLRPRR